MTSNTQIDSRTINAVRELITNRINPELTVDGGNVPLDQPAIVFVLMAMSLVAITDGLMAIADEHGVPLEDLLRIAKQIGVDLVRVYLENQSGNPDAGIKEVVA